MKIYLVTYRHGWRSIPDTAVNSGYGYQPIYAQIVTATSKDEVKTAICTAFSKAKILKIKLLAKCNNVTSKKKGKKGTDGNRTPHVKRNL